MAMSIATTGAYCNKIAFYCVNILPYTGKIF